MAIDGYGRELIVPKRLQVSTSSFDDRGRDVLDVWLSYDRRGSDQAPAGYGGCDSGKSEQTIGCNDGRVPEKIAGCDNGQELGRYRWQEIPRLDVARPGEASDDRRRPIQVPESDLPFPSSRTPPDDPAKAWPVFLGQILRVQTDPGRPPDYRVNLNDRPYAGLVGEEVRAPSNRVWVQIGAERADDDRRFAVFVPEADPSNPNLPRLEVDDSGEVDVRGATTMHGKLTMEGGAIALEAGQAQSQPWTIYRHSEGGVDQLRIQMDDGAGAGTNQVVVGVWNEEDGQFVECLVVKDDCSVTINGDLKVEGVINADSFIAPGFTADAQQFLLASALNGISGPSKLSNQSIPGIPQAIVIDFLNIIPGAPAFLANELLNIDHGRVALADALLADKSIAQGIFNQIGPNLVRNWLDELNPP
jgi:hypothetical protein